jgi:hypothetical protein
MLVSAKTLSTMFALDALAADGLVRQRRCVWKATRRFPPRLCPLGRRKRGPRSRWDLFAKHMLDLLRDIEPPRQGGFDIGWEVKGDGHNPSCT